MLENKAKTPSWLRKGLVAILLTISSAMAFSAPASAKEFTYENLLYPWMKLDAYFDYDAYVDCYMREYRNDVWQRSREDEFIKDEKRTETIDLMKDRVGEANLEDVFTVRTKKEFGEYDFEEGVFTFNPVSKTAYFYESNGSICSFPQNLKVKFSNADIMEGIEMAKDEAQAFLTSRKRGSSVDRSVTMEIDFVLTARDGEMLVANITEARVLNIGQYRDYDGAVLETYEGSAPAAAPAVAASPQSLSLFGFVPGGSLQTLRDELPRGSLSCSPAGDECEVHLKTGQTLVAKLDSSDTITVLEHRVKLGNQQVSETVDELKATYGSPTSDKNQAPKAGGFSTFGQAPAQPGQRTLIWPSEDYELKAVIFYGAGDPTEVVTTIRPR